MTNKSAAHWPSPVLTGGDADLVDVLSEEDISRLERAAFMALLLHTPATMCPDAFQHHAPTRVKRKLRN